ncbi:hypothetical protein BS17DRAFT_764170 [Gyrodon lividus]|nr:hypothetical protein BS17DRAFT_764170 [Gyrodon lividus]
MPAKIFSNEQTAILERLAGKVKVQKKEDIIAQIVEKVTKVHHRSDIQGMKKLHKEMSDKEEYFRKTNWFSVFMAENTEKIKEKTSTLTDLAPGAPGYVKYWRQAALALSKTLSREERESYVDMAEEWNTKGVPTEVQRKQMKSNLAPFLCQPKARSLKDCDGPLLKTICPNWDKEPFGTTWLTYLHEVYSVAKDTSTLPVESKKKFEVKKADDGHWSLPLEGIFATPLEQQKRLVRDFMNSCWQEAAGQRGGTSFLKMMKDRQDNWFLWPIFAFKEASTKQPCAKWTSDQLLNGGGVLKTPRSSRGTTANPTRGATSISSPSHARGNESQPATVRQLPSAPPSDLGDFNPSENNIEQASLDHLSSFDDGENMLDMWQSPCKNGGSMEHQVDYLRSLANQREYLELIKSLHLAKMRMSPFDANGNPPLSLISGGVNWTYNNFHVPREGHAWSLTHEVEFSADLFSLEGEQQGKAQLLNQALFASMLIQDAEIISKGWTPLVGYPFIPPELKGKTIH